MIAIMILNIRLFIWKYLMKVFVYTRLGYYKINWKWNHFGSKLSVNKPQLIMQSANCWTNIRYRNVEFCFIWIWHNMLSLRFFFLLLTNVQYCSFWGSSVLRLSERIVHFVYTCFKTEERLVVFMFLKLVGTSHIFYAL